MSQTPWDKMIEVLLGDENPCTVCAVQVMCRKSFVHKKAGGCPELKVKLEKALDKVGEKK